MCTYGHLRAHMSQHAWEHEGTYIHKEIKNNKITYAYKSYYFPVSYQFFYNKYVLFLEWQAYANTFKNHTTMNRNVEGIKMHCIYLPNYLGVLRQGLTM